MPKKLFTAALILLAACNNTNTPTPTDSKNDDNTIPEEEKRMKALITQHPDSFLLKENLIQYYSNNGNYSSAIAEIEDALKKDTTNDHLFDIAANVYFNNGDTLKAMRSLEKAIEIKANPEYLISLGSLYATVGNPMALVMADALLQAPLANAQSQAIFIKGLYFSTVGDKAKAIVYFNQCIALNYNDMLAYREKAMCLYDLEKYTEAIEVLTTAINIRSNFEEAYYWLGRCYEKLNKRKEAIENYQMAISLSEDYIEAKDALSKLGVSN